MRLRFLPRLTKLLSRAAVPFTGLALVTNSWSGCEPTYDAVVGSLQPVITTYQEEHEVDVVQKVFDEIRASYDEDNFAYSPVTPEKVLQMLEDIYTFQNPSLNLGISGSSEGVHFSKKQYVKLSLLVLAMGKIPRHDDCDIEKRRAILKSRISDLPETPNMTKNERVRMDTVKCLTHGFMRFSRHIVPLLPIWPDLDLVVALTETSWSVEEDLSNADIVVRILDLAELTVSELEMSLAASRVIRKAIEYSGKFNERGRGSYSE